MNATASTVLSALLAAALLGGCDDSEDTSGGVPPSNVYATAALAASSGSATRGADEPATAATAVGGTATATGSGSAAVDEKKLASTVQCQELNAVLLEFGKKMLEGTEKDPERRAHLFKEMHSKNETMMDNYLSKCTALSESGVLCATEAMGKADTVALLECPIDLAELEPDALE